MCKTAKEWIEETFNNPDYESQLTHEEQQGLEVRREIWDSMSSAPIADIFKNVEQQ